MKEKILYFNIKNDNARFLLYTFSENYNGNADYIKVYAVPVDENNLVNSANISEELHSKLRNIISLLGHGDTSSIEIYDTSTISEFSVVGKPFAIPKIYVDMMRKINAENTIQIVDNIINVDMENNQDVPAINNQSLEISDNENFEKPEQHADVEYDITGETSLIPNGDIEASTNVEDIFAATEVNVSKSTVDVEPDVESISTVNSMPTIEELENAVSIIQKYIEFMKKKTVEDETSIKKEDNNPQSDEFVSNNDMYYNSNSIVNDNVNISDNNFFVEQPVMEEQPMNYVAVSNENEQVVNNEEISKSFPSQEPVIMPDNFVGKNDNNFQIEGMSPSTLDSSGDIFKFVA